MDRRLVLAGATVIDGAGAPPVDGQAVVVEGGRIVAVPAAARGPGGRVLRLRGLTLLLPR